MNSRELAAELASVEAESDQKVRDARMFDLMASQCKDETQFAKAFLQIRNKRGDVCYLDYNHPQTKLVAALDRQRKKGQPQRVIVPKARQEGVSTFAESVIFGRVTRKPNRTGLVIAHKKDSSQALFDMTRFFLQNLPWGKPTDFSSRREIIYAPPHNSSMRIESAENRQAGRSQTNHYVHCSEVAFWPAPDLTMAGLLPTVPDHADTLVILESTGNGIGGYYYDTYMQAKQGDNEFEAVFLPWFDDPLYCLAAPEGMTWKKMDLDDEEVILKEVHKCSIEQIMWRRWKIRQMSNKMDIFKQEFPATDQEAFLATGRPVFRSDLIAAALTEPKTPAFKGRLVGKKLEQRGGGPLTLWEMPNPKKRYVMGVDTAQGFASSDLSVACVLDGETMEQVAELTGRWDVHSFAQHIVDLAEYYNNAFVSIEINNHGLSVLNYVRDIGYWNLLSRQTYEHAQKQWVNRLGWQTSVKTRPILVDDAAKAFHEGDCAIHSVEVLNQMSRFNFNDDGEPQSPKGTHDDNLFAFMIALQAFKHAWSQSPSLPRKEYKGEDAWVWRRMDEKIKEAEEEKNARFDADIVDTSDLW